MYLLIEMADDTLRYIKTDFQSHKQALLDRVRSRFPNVWNSFLFNGPLDFGNLLVDLVAWANTTLAFIINRQAGESFVSTMTTRESAQRIGSLVGYKVAGPTPASVAARAFITSAQATKVTIPAGTLVRSNTDNVPFEVAEDFVILAGNTVPETAVVSFNVLGSGTDVVETNLSVQHGSQNVDLVDKTIDVSQYVSVNQSIRLGSDSTLYRIEQLSTSDDSGVTNRMILDTAYSDPAGVTDVQVVTASVVDTQISLTQGQTVSDRFVTPTTLSLSYVVKLTQTNVILNSIRVTVNDVAWTKVNNIFESEADDTVFTEKVLVNGKVVLQFGNDNFGAAVPQDAVVIVSYRVGGGELGNIARDEINTSVRGLISGSSNPATIFIRNEYEEGKGGTVAETVEQARQNIPAYIRANDRAVTTEDYEVLSRTYSDSNGSISFARAVVRTANTLIEGNTVIVYAWTRGVSGTLVALSSPLKTSLQAFLKARAVATDNVLVSDGVETPAPVSLRFLVSANVTKDDAIDQVNATITDIIQGLEPGDPIVYSKLLSAVDETIGVDTVTFATPLTDLLTNDDNEVFGLPSDSKVYDVTMTSIDTNVSEDDDDAVITTYTASLPVSPLQPWAITLTLGETELTLMPHTVAGYARVYNKSTLSISDDYKSTIDLASGLLTLNVRGTQGDLTMTLKSVQAYTQERFVNIYIGYTGDTSASKRSEIRRALRKWETSFAIGDSLFAEELTDTVLSKANIKDLVAAISNVTSVDRVALDSPSSTDLKINASNSELIRLGQIVLNNSAS